jgi:hypothetical protein
VNGNSTETNKKTNTRNSSQEAKIPFKPFSVTNCYQLLPKSNKTRPKKNLTEKKKTHH